MAAISNEEYNGFRFNKFLNDCGRRVLYKTFRWGTPDKPDNIKLDDYLNDLGKPGKFNKTQKELIDNSPDGSDFDVSLLFQSIKLACKDVAEFSDPKWFTESSEMEYYVTAIKNMRNNALHGKLAISDEELLKQTNNLLDFLINCLKASGERYGRDEAEVNLEIKQVEDDLDNIKHEILGEEDLIKYCSDKIKQLMIENSSKRLEEVFQNIVYINPVSFITDNLWLEVDKIFVDIEVKHGKRRGEGEHIDYRELLKLVQSPVAPPSMSAASQQPSPALHPTVSAASQQQGLSARPQILLVEGVAGSGKTTLVTMVTQDWIKKDQGKIKGLDNYELMLWVQCRNSIVHSYLDLLDRLMPDVSLKFRNLLPRLMKLCKLLIVVDGLDEINENSRKLVNSLLQEFKNASHTTFICTSRPEKLEMFKNTIPREYEVTIAELRGILKDRILEFLRLNHQVIKKMTKSERSTEQLVKVVEKLKGLQEHLSLPMNLILLVYIWDQAPEEQNMTTITQTELYNKIHRLCLSKLLERLANHPQTNAMSKDDLEDGIQGILKVIYRISLESLSRDQLILENEIIKQVKLTCKNEGLPQEELLSAFLSLKPIWTWEGVQERYSAPHKGIQDYYSAEHIVANIKCELKSHALKVSHDKLTTTLPTTPSPSATPSPSTPTPARHSRFWRVWKHVMIKLKNNTHFPSRSGIIRKVLKETLKTDEVGIGKYQNVLVHVAGLLHLTMDQVPEALVREVVALLHESGMWRESQWLDLLENTNVLSVTAKAVAPFINSKRGIDISDSRVRSYAALLPHLKPSKVSISIKSDPSALPCLPDLLAGLTRHHCVMLSLEHHYYHDHTTTSDHILQCLQPLSELKVFMGCLSGDYVAALAPSLEQLYLAVVSDDQARFLLPQLHTALTSRLPQLVVLQVRVAAEVFPAALVPLPEARRVWLDLSGVSDTCVSHACHVASKLQPPGGYWTIGFLGATLTAAGCQELMLGLDHYKVKVEKLVVPDLDTLSRHEENQLKTLARTVLQCGFIRRGL
ncbi:uncharacterized protein [Procambarus clarkii]|uniref:uncharacterized protein isoform X2 n=1 Tax=Procambarus clarkii TaxID=6728 RepID=UPI0037447D70